MTYFIYKGLLFVFLLLISSALFSCTPSQQYVDTKNFTSTTSSECNTSPAVPDVSNADASEAEMIGNLMTWAKDSSEASNIAALYEITLVMYSDNIAVFSTDRNLDEIIQLGKENGWPELSKISTGTGLDN